MTAPPDGHGLRVSDSSCVLIMPMNSTGMGQSFAVLPPKPT
jgi:hypothetical protein